MTQRMKPEVHDMIHDMGRCPVPLYVTCIHHVCSEQANVPMSTYRMCCCCRPYVGQNTFAKKLGTLVEPNTHMVGLICPA